MRLQGWRFRNLPRTWNQGSSYVFVTGEPGFGIGTTVSDGRRELTAEISMRKNDKGVKEATFFARADGLWANAFGIDGFHIHDARLLVGMDATQNVTIGTRGQLQIGSKRVLVAGRVKVNAATGVVTDVILEGGIDSIGSADLVRFANATRGGQRALSARALPDFTLRNAYFRYAPLGGDTKLGIKRGLAIKGTLLSMNRTLGHVDGEADMLTRPATIRLHGHIADFSADPVALRDAAVSIHLGPTANPYFRVKGSSRMWITRKTVDIDLSRERIYWRVDDKVGGVFAATQHFRSTNGGRQWYGDYRFRNDLSRTLERDVSRMALGWAKKVEADNARSVAKIDAALRVVRSLDRQIDAARAQVRRDRAKATNDLRAAEARVKQLDGLIRARKAQLHADEVKLYNTYTWHKANTSKKYKAWKKAVAATKKAPVWRKPKYKAKEAKA